jgi:hypothetical protein
MSKRGEAPLFIYFPLSFEKERGIKGVRLTKNLIPFTPKF